ncbi:S41 family peptidase [Chryseobacterium angstadtii]|uniref:S41 family peptidase n=1 Tax=Chryseobacterium angstadtii TaxID=558151 RepID=UPI00065ADCBE|nr:S41 family peptidase [Chryseobacterium angstadtii]
MKKILIAISLFYSLVSYAQKEDIKTVLSEITEKVKSHYINKETYKKVDSLLQSEYKKGTFNNLNKKDFSTFITQKLRTDIKDKHFFFKYLDQYSPEKLVDEKQKEKENDFHNSLENFGFENVLRMEGNIGYINLKGFASAKSSEKTLAAAMNFVANTNSLIIDLRENGGGDNEMLLLFCSYFFDKKTDLYTTYFRNKDKTVMNSTQPKVSGQKYLHKKVYILTSEKSFSASEGMAFFLREHKVAEVIGETTGGGANPGEHFILQNKYFLFVPAGEVKSVISHKNWEQVGVTPDLEVKPENALKAAHIRILKDILKTGTRTELSILEIKNLINKLEQ